MINNPSPKVEILNKENQYEVGILGESYDFADKNEIAFSFFTNGYDWDWQGSDYLVDFSSFVHYYGGF